MASLHWLCIVLVLCELRFCVALQQNFESAPTDLIDAHVAILATVAVTVGVLLFGMLVLWATQRVVRLSLIIMVCAWAVIIGVGMVGWAVTYTTSRDVITDLEKKLLLTTAETIRGFETDLAAGNALLKTISTHVLTGKYNPHAAYPGVNVYIVGLVKSVEKLSRVLSFFFLGLENGDVEGCGPVGEDGSVFLVTGLPNASTPLFEGVVCDPKDHATQDVCESTACGNVTHDLLCQKHCNLTASASLCRPTPGPAMLNGVFTYDASNASLSPPPEKMEVSQLDVLTRPWYKVTHTITWSEPFLWFGSPGFTSSIGLFSAAGM